MKGKDQAKILAKGVYTALSGKDKKQSDLIVKNFLAYLEEHRLVKMVPDILAELQILYFAEQGIVKAEISAKDKLNDVAVKNITEIVQKKTGKKVEVSQIMDETLLGGAIIKYEDKVIDLSLKNQLNKLAKQLSN